MFGVSAAQRGSVGLFRCWLLTVSPTTTPRWPLLSSRSCFGSAPDKSPALEPLRRWALTVSPFTTVKAQVSCNIIIRPLDPHAFPEADRAFISVHGPNSHQVDCQNHIQVHYDEQNQELVISTQRVDSHVTIEMDAPLKSNLFITTEGKGDVEVKKMECEICRVQTQTGNCLLHSVKGHRIEVRSHGGHVTGLGTIHGNVDINTRGDGWVNVKKLQGTTMNVSTEHGSLKVKAVYAESNSVSSCSGPVELGHVHGNTTVKNVSGDTVIDGSNSFLKVSSNSGDIDAYVGDGGAAELHSQEGAVSVRVPSSLRVGVNLCGASVEISPEVVLHGVEHNTTDGWTTLTGCLNGEFPADRWVRARAERGPVRLRTQSWFESLKLGS
ncbi:protein FAM185A [Nematolebias whitei]|uniref:protein FAM185A n=1 Tax=Nematolebias whitei TaxID=451745 RepID=UPI00189B75B0|nr:protein FAM185A [Nematolebias whitei]